MNQPSPRPQGSHNVAIWDITNSMAIERDLYTYGVALFDGATPEAARLLFDQVAEPVGHRDADANKVTRIHPNHPSAGSPGYDGFTHKSLPPHTDGSGLLVPPEVLLTVVEIAPECGGDIELVIVADLIAALAPDVVEELMSMPVDIGSTPITAPVITRCGGKYQMRWRDDRLIDFSRLNPATISTLRIAIRDLTIRIPGIVGRGYLLANDSVLHGRSKFVGYRCVHRCIGRALARLDVGVAA